MRLEVYTTLTEPLLDYYGTAGMLRKIDGIGRPEEIHRSDPGATRQWRRPERPKAHA